MKKYEYALKISMKTGNFQRYMRELEEFKDVWCDNSQWPLVLSVAFDMNVCGLGMACYQNFLYENKETLSAVCMVFEHAFNHLEHSLRAEIAYAVRMIEKYPDDISGYQFIFSANSDPCCDLPLEEALEFAELMLRKWPDDKSAQDAVLWRSESIQKVGKSRKFFIEKFADRLKDGRRETFKWLLLEGRFSELRLITPDFFEEEIDQMLREIAFETNSVCSYVYLWFRMRDQVGESTKKHLLMAELCKSVFEYEFKGKIIKYDGMDQLVFFHTYRAAQLSPEDIELQELLLSLYEVGNESFEVEEALTLAQRVLQEKPESDQAQRVLRAMI